MVTQGADTEAAESSYKEINHALEKKESKTFCKKANVKNFIGVIEQNLGSRTSD